MDNLLHHTSDVAIALSLCPLAFGSCVLLESAIVRAATYEIIGAELGGSLVQAGVGREDGAATLTLVPDNTTHGEGVVWRGVMSREIVDAAWSWRLCAKRKFACLPALGAPRLN